MVDQLVSNVQQQQGVWLGDITANPYPYYHWLRTNQPVLWDDNEHVWRLTRYQDVREILFSPNVTSFRMSTFATLDLTLLNGSDSHQHRHLRNVIHDRYMGTVVMTLGEQVKALAHQLIASVSDSDQPLNFVDRFARPFPQGVMRLLMGIDLESDQESLIRLGDNFAAMTGGGDGGMTTSQFRAARKSIHEWNTRFAEMLIERQHRPQMDLLGVLAHAWRDGAITKGEAIGLSMEMAFASVKNVANGLGLMLYALLQNPATMAEMRANPARLHHALDELLRYDSSVQLLSRIALTDIPIGDQVIREGQRIVLYLGAANRDPARFADPDAINFNRTDNAHLSFGYGAHFCIGLHLAWLEIETAFRTLLDSFTTIELAGEVEWSGVLGYRGLKSLPIRVTR